MNPDSTLNINAVEAFPVEEFSAEVNNEFSRKHIRRVQREDLATKGRFYL